MKHLFTVLLLTLGLLLVGQGEKNPFDIEGRKPVVKTKTLDIPATEAEKERVVQSTAQPVVPPAEAFDASKENPFDVDHVPLRRAEVRAKKAKAKAKLENKKNPKLGKSFVFWLNLVIWGLLALVLAQDRLIISNLWRALMNENLLKLHKRDTGLNIGNFILYIVYFLCIASFVYLAYAHYYPSFMPYFWVKILVAFVGVYMFRHLFYYIMGNTFNISKEVSLYNYVIYIANILIGVCLIPINLLMAYGPEGIFKTAFYLGVAVIAILLILRYLRGLTISLKFISSSFLLFFIYLCVAEISPILIFIKAFLGK